MEETVGARRKKLPLKERPLATTISVQDIHRIVEEHLWNALEGGLPDMLFKAPDAFLITVPDSARQLETTEYMIHQYIKDKLIRAIKLKDGIALLLCKQDVDKLDKGYKI